jgi:hypothetical protein
MNINKPIQMLTMKSKGKIPEDVVKITSLCSVNGTCLYTEVPKTRKMYSSFLFIFSVTLKRNFFLYVGRKGVWKAELKPSFGNSGREWYRQGRRSSSLVLTNKHHVFCSTLS